MAHGQAGYWQVRIRQATRVIVALVGLSGSAAWGQDDEEPLKSDRPDFTETSSTVGRGLIQIESGYTYLHDSEGGVATDDHSLPELLVRIGLTDEFELRLEWEGWISSRLEDRRTGTAATSDGVTDLGIGFKVELSEQCECGWQPETALIVAMTVPTGDEGFGSDKVQPVANFLYSWELSEDWSLGGSTGIASLHEDGDGFVEFSQSLSVGHSLADNVGSYVEWFMLARDDAAEGRPEHYLDGGFTYSVTPNFQLDVRAGIGLNEAADDFFAGPGFAVRF